MESIAGEGCYQGDGVLGGVAGGVGKEEQVGSTRTAQALFSIFYAYILSF